jgi:hypothetical protein
MPTSPRPILRRLTVLAACTAALGVAGCSGGEGAEPEQPSATVELPLQQTADLEEAVEAAGCEIYDRQVRTAEHEDREFTADDYDHNPPVGGNHTPVWYEDGIYEPGASSDLGMLVHTLEHGRINVQYSADASDATVEQLEALLAETEGYHMLLYENATDMPYEVAATAWGHAVGCEEMSDDVFDVLRTFRTEYIDQGPERVP